MDQACVRLPRGVFFPMKPAKMPNVLITVIVSLFALISCGNETVLDVSRPIIRLLSPRNGAIDLDTTVTLTWEATPSGVASVAREGAIGTIAGYRVYCAPEGSNYPAPDFCIDKELTKTNLAEGRAYRWKVEVVEQEGKSQSSPEFVFTTKAAASLPWDEEELSEPAVYTMEGAIWVSSVGDDLSGSGSEAHPYRTIGKALSQCAGGETIVLKSGVYAEAVRIRRPNVTLRSAPGHWAIVQVTTDDEESGVAVTLDVDSSGSKIQSLEIIGGYYYGIKFETRWDWGTEDRSGASDIVIEDCVIHDTGRDAVKITPQCDRITIRRCEIYASGVGIGNQGNPNAEGIDNVNGDRMKVQECYLHDISTTGIYFKGGAQECVVERNVVENCGGSGILIGFDTSPEYFDLTVNPEYYESMSGIVRNNIVANTAYAGIGLYAAKDAQVYHNTIARTAREGMSPITFGITFQDWEPEAGRPPSIRPTLINNLVYQESDQRPIIVIRYSDELGGLSALEGSLEIDGNCYYTAGEIWFQDRRPEHYLEHASFEDWKEHIDGESYSFCSDPLLTERYRLLSGSPCIDLGISLDLVRYDVDSQPRQNPFDIGACEYRAAQ